MDLILQINLVNLYCKFGEFRDAQKVFDEMFERDIACWNALICGLPQGGFANEALELFYRIGLKLKVNDVTVLGAFPLALK